MNRFGKRQDGLTLLSQLLVLAVIGFFAYTGIKLVPIYLEYFSVSSSLKSLAEDGSQGLAGGELQSRLLKRLEINNVTHVSADDIRIRNEGNAKIVAVQYEVLEPLYGNVSLLVSFEDSVKISGN